MATRAKKAERRKKRQQKRQHNAERLDAKLRNVPSDFQIEATGTVELTAAEPAEEGGKAKLRRFSMVAYNGGPMRLAGFYYPVVVDLAGLDAGNKPRPIFRDHDPGKVVGHSTTITNNGRRLTVEGEISGANDHAREVVESSDQGFPWQVSIGASAERMVFLDKGEKTTVNGKEVTGPAYIARRSRLRETSFVALGADDTTRARMVAALSNSREGNGEMTFEQWLEAGGWGGMDLSEAQLKNLQAAYDAEIAAAADDDDDDSDDSDDINAGGDNNLPGKQTAAEQIRAEALAEVTRINKIRAACHGEYGDFDDIEAQAIKGGWTTEATELAVLRAARPKAPAQHSKTLEASANTLEAALMLNCTGLAEDAVGKHFDEKTMNAAIGRQYRGVGLHYLMHQVIKANGMHYDAGRVDDDFVRCAFNADDRAIRAGAAMNATSMFSTISLSGILGNVANKTMLASYRALNTTWQRLCRIASANDFKTHTRYRLTGVGQFQEVGKNGELKHVSLSEDSYSNKVDTHGAMLALTREDMINDDMGAFLELARILGRMAGISVEKALYILILANPGSFWSSGNNNYQSGAGTALDIDALSAAEVLFMNQTDSNGDPILLLPKYLLCPTTLKVTAENLFKETGIVVAGDTDTTKINRNPHAGKFQPIVSPYLNAQSLSGSSSTGWYLWGDPMDVAPVEVAFLKGKQTPTIESGETSFNTLGIEWRSYLDFGVATQDHRGSVFSLGDA